MPTVITVKSTGPMADMKRKNCMEAINGLTDTELKNFEKLLNSIKAKSYLGNPIKFAMLQKFM